MFKIIISILSFCLLLTAGSTEIRLSPKHIFSIDNLGKRSESNVRLEGIPWSNFSRVFVQFDLSEIRKKNVLPHNYKANLIVKCKDVNNSSNLPLEIGLINTRYDHSKVTWQSPGYPESKWPRQQGHHNIDYSATFTKSQIPTQDSAILVFEVTSELKKWIDGKVMNNGFMLRMGPTIFGKPKTDSWHATIYECRLLVTVTGENSETELDRKTIACYPSALLPPISNPYHFLVFCGDLNPHPASCFNMIGAKLHNARPERGILPMTWHYGPQTPAKTEEAVVGSYTKQASKVLAIEVDEWQGNMRANQPVGKNEDPNRLLKEQKIAWSIKGIQEAKRINPAFFILVYWRGENSIIPLTKLNLPDLLVVEGQSLLAKRFPKEHGVSLDVTMNRLNFAKNLGVIEKTIPMFGFLINKEMYHEGQLVTPDMIETWIKAAREKFPESPGIAFYSYSKSNQPEAYATFLMQKAEELCYKYFILPAPKVSIKTPHFEETIHSPQVPIIASAEAVGKNTIMKYKFFVDNRLMAESKNNIFTLDTRLYGNGRHIITVHAIDSKWNRGVAQLPITIDM